MEIVVSFIIGVFLVLVGVAIASRTKKPGLKKLLSMLMPSSTSDESNEIFGDALEELRQDEPELAKIIVGEPKSPVENQQAEFKPYQAAEVKNAPDDESALKIVRKYTHDKDIAQILVTLARWNPRRLEAGIDLE